VTFAGQVFREEDIPSAKYPFLATARLYLRPPLDGYHIFPADNVMPWILIPGRNFPEKNSFCTGRLTEESKGPFGLKIDPDVLKTGVIIRSVVESGNFHRHHRTCGWVNNTRPFIWYNLLYPYTPEAFPTRGITKFMRLILHSSF
jgi:hypothetical protein